MLWDFVENDFVRQSSNVRDFAFCLTDEDTGQIYIRPGSWDIDKNLIIPSGYNVVCDGGTQLNLLNGAKILSYSALKFIGSEGNPVIIRSRDSKGQGIVVISARDKSNFSHVIIDNLSSPSHDRWELTGAVTFYQSPLISITASFQTIIRRMR